MAMGKNLVGGTAYDTTEGKDLVGATAYGIKMGKSLVDGTAFDIGSSISEVLNDNDWATIREVSDAGMAANYWAVGDTKSITINGTVGKTTFSSLSIDAFILGINHNADVEGSNRIHFGLGKISGVDVALCDSKYGSYSSASGYFVMNKDNKNTGGWESSYLRSDVLGSDSVPASPTANTLLAVLPADLRDVMKSVTKYSDNTGGGSTLSSNVTPTTDYLPLLAEFEVQGTRTYANKTEKDYQKQYDYYKAGNSKAKYKHSATSTACSWWLRSVYSYSTSTTNRVCYVSTKGAASANTTFYSYGISPLFAV